MRLIQHSSSSAGNLYELSSGDSRILIECGLPWQKLIKHLNYDLSGVDFCLLSHEHKDHSKAATDIISNGIKLCASEGTLEALGLNGNRSTEILTSNVRTIIGKWRIYAFDVCHDAEEPQGYVISDGVETVLFVTDSYNIEYAFKIPFDLIAIECSYDKEILSQMVNDDITNETYAKRLLVSHLEQEASKAYLNQCDLSKCREIHLIHMSSKNINKQQVISDFKETFMTEIIAL